MLLKELLKAIRPVEVAGDSDIEITGVNIDSITGNFFYSGIVYSFHEGVSIIKEISSAGYEFLNNFEMTMQGYIYQVTELFRRFVKKAGAFFKS